MDERMHWLTYTHCGLMTSYGGLWSWSRLAQVMFCCLRAPSYYLNWLIYGSTIIHCLGLGHETMVGAVCLSIFLSKRFENTPLQSFTHLPMIPLTQNTRNNLGWYGSNRPVRKHNNTSRSFYIFVGIYRTVLCRNADDNALLDHVSADWLAGSVILNDIYLHAKISCFFR